MGRIFSHKLYVVPGAPRPFYHLRDAHGWCEDNSVPRGAIECWDSQAEYKRWLQLKDMEARGEISGLKRQERFELIPPTVEIVKVREKKVRRYVVVTDEWWRDDAMFTTKALAEAYRKKHGGHIEKQESIEPVFKKKTTDLGAHYTADFVYYKDCVRVVEDVKSEFTRKEKDYILRKKMLKYLHKIEIKEVIL